MPKRREDPHAQHIGKTAAEILTATQDEQITIWEQHTHNRRWLIVRTYSAHYSAQVIAAQTAARPLAGWAPGIDPNAPDAPPPTLTQETPAGIRPHAQAAAAVDPAATYRRSDWTGSSLWAPPAGPPFYIDARTLTPGQIGAARNPADKQQPTRQTIGPGNARLHQLGWIYRRRG